MTDSLYNLCDEWANWSARASRAAAEASKAQARVDALAVEIRRRLDCSDARAVCVGGHVFMRDDEGFHVIAVSDPWTVDAAASARESDKRRIDDIGRSARLVRSALDAWETADNHAGG